MKMTVKRTFFMQGQLWAKGDVIELDKHYSTLLKQAGLVEAVAVVTAGSSEPVVQPNYATQIAKPSKSRKKASPALPLEHK